MLSHSRVSPSRRVCRWQGIPLRQIRPPPTCKHKLRRQSAALHCWLFQISLRYKAQQHLFVWAQLRDDVPIS